MERKSGVLMHISSLFGDYSIGSFGNEAKYTNAPATHSKIANTEILIALFITLPPIQIYSL